MVHRFTAWLATMWGNSKTASSITTGATTEESAHVGPIAKFHEREAINENPVLLVSSGKSGKSEKFCLVLDLAN